MTLSSLNLYPGSSNLEVAYWYRAADWKDPVPWSVEIGDSQSVLIRFADTATYFAYMIHDARSSRERDSLTDHAKRTFVNRTLPFQFDTVAVGDSRRAWFKEASLRHFQEYWSKEGYSRERIEEIHNRFWTSYKDKPIICFHPNPEPAGPGLFCYDPNMNRIVHFYSP
jgi:hypothetical protein